MDWRERSRHRGAGGPGDPPRARARRRPPRSQAGEHHAPRSGRGRLARAPRRPSRSWTSGSPVSNRSDTALTRDGTVLRLRRSTCRRSRRWASAAAPARTSSRWARSCARCSWAGPGSMRRASPRSWHRVVHDDPPHLAILRPDLPASLDAVLGHGARQDARSDRYATAAGMADDLEDVLAGRSASHAPARGPALHGARPARPPPDLLEAFARGNAARSNRPRTRGRRAAASAAQTVPARVIDPRHDRHRPPLAAARRRR